MHDTPLYDVSTEGADTHRGPSDRPARRRRPQGVQGLVAVNDVDFVIPSGSIVSLIGPNGAGKTTFFNMLTGVYKPTAGTITFDEHNVTVPPHAITQRGIGRTFQNIRLFQQMTALENVLVGMHSRLHGGIIRSVLHTPGLKREEWEAAIARGSCWSSRGSWQARVGCAQPLVRRPAPARGGEGACDRAEALLLDEPTAGMNPQETAAFTDSVSKLRVEQSLTVLMIEHDMKVVMGLDRVTVLDYGEKIAEGAPKDVQKDERVIEAYLGRGDDDSMIATETQPQPQGTEPLGRRRDHPRPQGRRDVLRLDPGAEGDLDKRPRGRDRDADRRERRGQVDDAAVDQRPQSSVARDDPFPGPRHHEHARASDREDGHLAVARRSPALPAHVGAREPRDGSVPAAAQREADPRGPRPRLQRYSRVSTSARRSTRARCRAASSRWSRSAAP